MSTHTAPGAGILPELRVMVRAAAMAALLFGPISGCAEPNEHPKTFPVTGKVTYKGQPVPKGTITFQPDQGQAAVGEIQPDGTYQLSTFSQGDGAVAGHHRIFVIANTADPTKIPGSTPGWTPPKDLVPQKYNKLETSGLEATVSEDKKEYNFDLP
jgi:hypothetical protein